MTSIPSNLSIGKLSADQALAEATARKLDGETAAQWDRAEIKKVADQFESLFLNMVLKSMRNTVQKSGLVDGGNAEEIYRSMLDDEYAQQMAAQRQTGIADQIEDFMLKAQGLTPEPGAKQVGITAYRAAQAVQPKADAALQTVPKAATMDTSPAPKSKAL